MVGESRLAIESKQKHTHDLPLDRVEVSTLLDLVLNGHGIELFGRKGPDSSASGSSIGRFVVGAIAFVDHRTGSSADQV